MSSPVKRRARMVIAFMDSTGKARYTGLSVELESSMETWLAFTSFKQLTIKPALLPAPRCYYVVGYYNSVGVLFDTLCLDAEGFTKVTKQPALTEEQWLETDALIREAIQGAKRVSDL